MTRVTTTDAFVAWMEQLYLSELVLLSVKPAPKPPTSSAKRRRKPPARLVLELGLPDHAYDGARDRYRTWTLVATEIARWECDGTLDDDTELTIARAHGRAASCAHGGPAAAGAAPDGARVGFAGLRSEERTECC